MITYANLIRHSKVFLKMTGLRPVEFEQMLDDVLPQFETAEVRRLARADRQRAVGGGDCPDLAAREQILLTVIWLRLYPTHDVLGYLFGVSQPTIGRYLAHVLPVLEQAGRESMRMPDPGRRRRRKLPQLLDDIPDLAVVVDSFEQAVQRPRQTRDAPTWYSGKQHRHTVKSQVTVQEDTGLIAHLSRSVPGRTADITLVKQSGLLAALPPGVACLSDSVYQGIARLHPLARSPFKRLGVKPKPLTDAQLAYNRAFSARRIIVENTIKRLRDYQTRSQRDRQHRCLLSHYARVCAVAGLVNRQLPHRFAL